MRFKLFANQILKWLAKYLYINNKDEVEVKSLKKKIVNQ